MTRILVTGSRAWTLRGMVAFALSAAALRYGCDGTSITLVHGAARGLDTLAEQYVLESLWHENRWIVERYPADWATCGRAAGGIRNQRMVDLGADVCLAFPLPGSRGTWDCVRRAEAAGIPVHIHRPPEVTP